MKLVMRKMTMWGDKLYQIGHKAVVSEDVGKRWVSRGLAYEIKEPEVQRAPEPTYHELRAIAKEKGISTRGKKRDEIAEALNGDYDTGEGEADLRD